MPVPDYELQRAYAYAVTHVTNIPLNYKQITKQIHETLTSNKFLELLLQLSTKSNFLQNGNVSLHIGPTISIT
jgi:hypothetical protein